MAREIGVSLRINRVGSLWSIFFTNAPVVDLISVPAPRQTLRAIFPRAARGVYLPPSPMKRRFSARTRARSSKRAFEYAFKQLPPG